MKKIAFFLLMLVSKSIVYSQCDSNYLFKQGNKVEMSTFWWAGFGKFKELPKVIYEVARVYDSSSLIVSVLTKTSTQNNGKSKFKKEMFLMCDKTEFLYDPSFWLIDTILQKEILGVADIKTDTLFYFAVGSAMTFPFSGQTKNNLKPYNYRLIETDVYAYRDEKTTSSERFSGNEKITYTTTTVMPKKIREEWSSRQINFDSRTIVGIEKIITPAGSWSCYKVVNKDPTAKGLYKNISTVDYFAPGFGLVRTESYYNKRMTSYSEITKIF